MTKTLSALRRRRPIIEIYHPAVPPRGAWRETYYPPTIFSALRETIRLVNQNVNARPVWRQPDEEDCVCSAFKLPHRLAMTNCYSHEDYAEDIFCGCCGKPCEIETEYEPGDHYEFWGATGTTPGGWIESSDCCNTEVYLDPMLFTLKPCGDHSDDGNPY